MFMVSLLTIESEKIKTKKMQTRHHFEVGIWKSRKRKWKLETEIGAKHAPIAGATFSS